MSNGAAATAGTGEAGLKHEAVFYAGTDAFVDTLEGFIRETLDADERIFVMVDQEKIDLLRSALGSDASRVLFADMTEVGRNPARIIPAWAGFFAEAAHEGRGARGIGEPIWAARNADEIAESQRHEELINLAFPDAPGRLLCPYDTLSLDRSILEEALESHPLVCTRDGIFDSPSYRGETQIARPFEKPLPTPGAAAVIDEFGDGPLEPLRRVVYERALAYGASGDRASDLVTAVHEVAANSVRHGGGRGTVWMWADDSAVVCEVRDKGCIDDPLAGRIQPSRDSEGGFGLWLVNQLCDLVQVRCLATGLVVRLRVALT